MVIEVCHMRKRVCKVKRLIKDSSLVRCTTNIIIKRDDIRYRGDPESHTPTCLLDLAWPCELHRYLVSTKLEINLLSWVEVVLINPMHSLPVIAFSSDILTIKCDYNIYVGILFINLPGV